MARIQWTARHIGMIFVATLLSHPPPTRAFIEEIFQQAFGGGGGEQFQFQMGGDDGIFQMGGGGGGGMQRGAKWPKDVSDKITKKFSWMKGTEWNWNSWRNVKFQKDGSFEAPTQDCQGGQCKWSANKNKVYILWGQAGVHELDVIGQMPTEPGKGLDGLKLKGIRRSDGDACQAVFTRVFDHEAAELDKDLYEILGLQDDAEDVEIKKVYRTLSKKYHPDKNPDEESRRKFNDIRDAYEILNDPEKKILYDTGGMEAVKAKDKGEVKRGEDMQMALEVTLEELYNSNTNKATFNRRVVCRGCRAKPDSPKCRGCGRCPNEVKMVNQQVGPGMIMQREQEVQSKEKCKQEMTTLDAYIEKGMRNGEQITFPMMAEQRPGIIPGNVLFTLNARKHDKMERRGDDLHMEMRVPLREALLGWSQKIRHLDGHVLEIGTESTTKPYQVFKVAGEGMPIRDDSASFGDLYVKVEVIFPKHLSDEQQQAVDSIFEKAPPRVEL